MTSVKTSIAFFLLDLLPLVSNIGLFRIILCISFHHQSQTFCTCGTALKILQVLTCDPCFVRSLCGVGMHPLAQDLGVLEHADILRRVEEVVPRDWFNVLHEIHGFLDAWRDNAEGVVAAALKLMIRD